MEIHSKKKIIQRILELAGVCFLLLVSLMFLSNLLEDKSSDKKYADFFSEENEFDVLFMGTSHVMNAVFPMELWQNYGITSYNFGGPGNALPTTYWTMENALDYKTPKVMVIDGYYLAMQEKVFNNFSYVHTSFDAFPISITKWKAANDLLDDRITEEKIERGEILGEKHTKIGLLWNFSVYHTRWKELDEADFNLPVDLLKGCDIRNGVAVPSQFAKVVDSDKYAEESTGIEYLEKMIQDCQERNIEVLLVWLPYPASEEEQRCANRVSDIAQKYSVHYINFLNNSVIDYDTDCDDAGSHLNVSGGLKVTDYLGSYLVQNYLLTDKRNDILYEKWNKDLAEYKQYKIDNLRSITELASYLMLLSDSDFEGTIDLQDEMLLQEPYYRKLFSNLCADVVVQFEGNKNMEADIRIVCKDCDTKEIIDTVYFNMDDLESGYRLGEEK